MEPDLIPQRWVAHLARSREQSNAVLARARAAGADSEALRAGLREVGQVFEQLTQTRDETDNTALGMALVEVVASLVTAGRWRDGTPEHWAVLTVLPTSSRWLIDEPAGTVTTFVNGAHYISRSGDVTGWARRLSAGAILLHTQSGIPALRSAGAVAAWRSGAVRLRNVALAAARAMPDDAVAALLDLDLPVIAAHGGLASILDRHQSDPWWWPGTLHTTDVRVVARFGGFRGFGGPWTRLPRVRDLASDGLHWYVETDSAPGDVRDNKMTAGTTTNWVVMCDIHGSAVRRCAGDLPADASSNVRVSKGSIELGGSTGTLPWDDEMTGAASAGQVAVISRASSYVIDVIRAST